MNCGTELRMDIVSTFLKLALKQRRFCSLNMPREQKNNIVMEV